MGEISPDSAEADLWRETLEIVRMLAAGKYDELALVSSGVRLSASELRTAVEEHGLPLEAPPSPQEARFDARRVTASDPASWSVRCDLWSSGRPSDLTLELTLRDKLDGGFVVELDDLHVL